MSNYRRTRATTSFVETKTCVMCNSTFPQEHYYNYNDSRCEKCILKNLRCRWCGCTFEGKYLRCECCEKCDHYRYNLYGHLTPEEAYDDYKIKVTYAVKDEGHSGYCSDPYDIEIEYGEEILVLQLVRDFENPTLGPVDVSHPILKQYYERESDGCDRGSGYCGCLNRRKILSAEIVEGNTKIGHEKKILHIRKLKDEDRASSDSDWDPNNRKESE